MASEEQPIYCEGCGLALAPSAKFCKSCGLRVAVVSDSSTPIGSAVPAASRADEYPNLEPTNAEAMNPPPQSAPGEATAVIPVAPSAPQKEPDQYSNLKDSRWVIVAGAVALVVIAAVVLVVLQSRSSSTKAAVTIPPQSTNVPTTSSSAPASTTTTTAASSPRREAMAINTLLGQSSSDRSAIVGATNDISSCGNLSQDESTLNAAAQSRRLLIAELPQLKTAQLVGADQLISALTSAWQASTQSDASYAAWAGDLLSSGCTGQASTNDPNWQAAQVSDAQATAAKQQVATLWGPIASAYGLPQYTYTQL